MYGRTTECMRVYEECMSGFAWNENIWKNIFLFAMSVSFDLLDLN